MLNRTPFMPEYSNANARWTSGPGNGKSVEVHRSQVDDLFKNLQDGDELAETESGMLCVVVFVSAREPQP